MKTLATTFAAVSFALLTCVAVETAAGQSQSNTYRPAQANQVSSAAKIVGYRTTDWQTVHTASSDEADQTVATLKRIGCEVDTNNHGDHIDIKFRCPEWRSMKVKTHTLQAQWSSWCESQGLEIVVVNPPENTKRPTVMFQMAQPRTVHLHDQAAAIKILNTLTLIGCDIKTNDHNGHTDATFGCPDWRTIELASEDSAHAWQKWLKESGFETKHEQADNNDGSATRSGGSTTRRGAGSAVPSARSASNGGSSSR